MTTGPGGGVAFFVAAEKQVGRLGANRAALAWTERRKGTKRVRIALTAR